MKNNKTETKFPELFKSVKAGDCEFKNRIWMAPLTRSRSDAGENTQTPLHALYYSQRASAGLIISEATQISSEGQGYAWTPGIFTKDQVESWKLVTDAVHTAGGKMFCQLWHVGAISHNVFHDGERPVSSSAWQPEGKAFVGDLLEDGPQVEHPEARALKLEEIPRLLKDYQHAAKCAMDAGFDGVEFHAANGYLIDQFMRSSVNKRDDKYGGSLENRLRLLEEVADAICEVVPSGKVGVRLSPTGGPGGSKDKDPEALYTGAAQTLSGKGLCYLHVIRPNDHTGDGSGKDFAKKLMKKMKEAFDGTFVANGEFEAEEAEVWVKEGHADAITFGRMLLANPDLPARIAQDGPYNKADSSTFYGGGKEGYVDYPSLKDN